MEDNLNPEANSQVEQSQDVVESTVDESVNPEGENNQEHTEEQPKKKHDPYAKAFSAITKREKALLEKENAIKEREQRIKEWEENQKLKEIDPEAWLEKEGYDLDKLAQEILKGKDPQKAIQKEIEKLREEQAERELRAQRAENERRIAEFKESETQRLKAMEEFELVNELEQHNLVFDVMQEYYEMNGEFLPTEEAAKLVEAHLEEEEAKRLHKLQNIKKFKKQEVSSETTEATNKNEVEKPSSTPTQKQKESKTLTNDLSASAPTKVPEKKKLSDEESLFEAAKKLRFFE